MPNYMFKSIVLFVASESLIVVSAMTEVVENKENITTMMDCNKDESMSNSHAEQNTYDVIKVLGEGAYGEVMLVSDKRNPSIVAAMKVMNLKSEVAKKECKKEALIHQLLCDAGNHPNIALLLGFRSDGKVMRLFIEFADGGELFDQIEPEKGVGSVWRARHYFLQLMDGVSFIHKHGVAHRDLKPENLFLSKSDVLKIGDFGLATIFRHNGKERMLTIPCGTRPYTSPQVLTGSYRGEAGDLWSCGIILVAMLSGELPWGSPSMDCDQFASYVESRPGWEKRAPWCRIDREAMFVIKSILTKDEKARTKIDRLLSHPWITERPINTNTSNHPGPSSSKRRRGDDEESVSSVGAPAISQPAVVHSIMTKLHVTPLNNESCRAAFSQPTHFDLQLSEGTQTSTQILNRGSLVHLVRRMTRFGVSCDADTAHAKIVSVCTAHSIHTTSKNPTEIIGRHGEVTFIVCIYHVHIADDDDAPNVLVDFRRSHGDGLEFKRIFRSLRNDLECIISESGTNWLDANGITRSQLMY